MREGGARAGADRPDIVGTKAEIETGDELNCDSESKNDEEKGECVRGNELGENERWRIYGGRTRKYGEITLLHNHP